MSDTGIFFICATIAMIIMFISDAFSKEQVMGVNHRELLMAYIKLVERSEGVTFLEHDMDENFVPEDVEVLKELLDELGLWYHKEGK